MEFFLVVLGLSLLFLLLNIRKTINARFTQLDEELNLLRKQFAKSPVGASEQPAEPAGVSAPVATGAIKRQPPTAPEANLPGAIKPDVPPVVPDGTDLQPQAAVPETTESDLPVATKGKSLSSELETLLKNAESEVNKEREAAEKFQPAVPRKEAESLTQRLETSASQTPVPPPPPRLSFLERNPDLEKFIGENLISKIGIGILVLAIGFFVKYAIDNDWIGNVGRVGIGVLCGAILVFLGHRLRKSYHAFSSVLIGGGFAIFYFTITLAFHQFQIFSQTSTFIIMVVITAFAVALSLLNDRQELAIIALVGGFATPFMASNGSGNYNALFIYLIILNCGLLAIAYRKSWRLLNILAFLFTVILFSGWIYSLNETSGQVAAPRGLIYASVFYLMFLLINIAYNIRQNKAFISSDFGILLANTCLYFSAGLYLLTLMGASEYRGLFTIIIAVLNLLASFILFRNRKVDKNILYLLIGITLSFISLTAPIQLNGHNITLFWAAEAVLLLWLYQKSSIQLVRFASMLVWFAMLISLAMDLEKVYSVYATRVPVIINRGFVTGIFAAIACFLLYFLSGRKEQPEIPARSYPLISSMAYKVTGIVILYMIGMLEINKQFMFAFPDTGLYLLYLLLFTYAFAVVVLFTYAKKDESRSTVNYALSSIPALCAVIYLAGISETFAVQRKLLYLQKHLVHFTAHWLGAIMIGILIYRFISSVRNNQAGLRSGLNILTWTVCSFIVIFVSVEMHLACNHFYYSEQHSLQEIQRVFIKTGLPILWGLCSFGFMWLGMKHKFRPLRIVSLTLFSLILIKLFTFDIRNIPVAGKIAAFFSLGVLLLVISFMYQRLKKIITEDESKPVV